MNENFDFLQNDNVSDIESLSVNKSDRINGNLNFYELDIADYPNRDILFLDNDNTESYDLSDNSPKIGFISKILNIFKKNRVY